jgi:hypothetical protein
MEIARAERPGQEDVRARTVKAKDATNFLRKEQIDLLDLGADFSATSSRELYLSRAAAWRGLEKRRCGPGEPAFFASEIRAGSLAVSNSGAHDSPRSD